MIKTLLVILFCTTPLCAQSTFKNPTFTQTLKQPTMIASTAVCFGGATADLMSSHGQELNPIFRDANGMVNKPRVALVGYGACGGILLLAKWQPKLAKILGFAFGGVHFGATVHNSRY